MAGFLTRHADPHYGRGTHRIAEDDGLDEGQRLVRLALMQLRSPEANLPSLPQVALELLQLTRRIEVEFGDLVSVLRKDPLLAARVLRLARSPVHARGEPPRTLEHAATRLGLNGLRDIVWEAVFRGRVFHAPGFVEPMERVRRHSVTTAHIARVVARAARVDEDMSFLAGLLHDMGVAGLLLAIAEAPRDRRRPPLDKLWPAIDEAHGDAGAAMSAFWKLPGELQAVASTHHHWDRAASRPALTAIVIVAERLAGELGASIDPARPIVIDLTRPTTFAAACDRLCLDDRLLSEIRTASKILVRGQL